MNEVVCTGRNREADAPVRAARGRMAVAALTALAAWLTAQAAPSQPPAAPTRLRVLSYNIHHGEGTDGKVDLARLAKVIRGCEADLVALQEVDLKTRRTGGVDQTAELARLTGLHGRFGKGIDYEGGEDGQAVLSRSPIAGLTVHPLPGEPDRERRIAVEARVTVAGRDLSFVTTHLHHQNASFRERQAARLDELFGNVGRPVILAGDLNAVPGSKPLQRLAGTWTVATEGDTLATYPAAKPARQLDYVLYRPAEAFRVVERSVLAEAVASDHRPVLAVLELRQGGGRD
jgi:endonuclease/exonuclease/phosphatase family metal-dependent hydrolase